MKPVEGQINQWEFGVNCPGQWTESLTIKATTEGLEFSDAGEVLTWEILEKARNQSRQHEPPSEPTPQGEVHPFYDHPLIDAGLVVERLCKLQQEVFDHLNDDYPADCFCAQGGFWKSKSAPHSYGPTEKLGYRNAGSCLAFIETAVRDRMTNGLTWQGVKINVRSIISTLRRLSHEVRNERGPLDGPLWHKVSNVFALGSNSAQQLCIAAGFNPDEELKHEYCEDCVPLAQEFLEHRLTHAAARLDPESD